MAGDEARAAASAPAAPAQPISERRVTTVLFGDLVGFTPLSERLDAEDVRELLSEYFATCRRIIAHHGGTVDKFIGDAVMGVWGVPIAREDDAARAVRAGLELVDAVRDLGPRVGASDLAMRVGIVTGPVAVTIGATGEGMVAGDSVNTASRIQGAAIPGQVWTDETTRALTSGVITFADAGTHELKGKSKPVRLWQAQSVLAGSKAERFDGLHAPLSGRDVEMRILHDLLDATIASGRPRLLVLDGEAGTGKSRMVLEEFEAQVVERGAWWLQGRCLSYGEGVSFRALTEAIRSRLGLVEGEALSESAVDAALTPLIPDLGERAWLLPRLSALMGTAPADGLSRESLFDAWASFFELLAEAAPLVLVMDDAQHADDDLLSFIESRLMTGASPILLLLLARPELLARRPDLGGRRATVVRLEPISDEAMAVLVEDLVDGLPVQTRDDIVARAEGVPLYAVETVRSLVDADLVIPVSGRYAVAPGAILDVASLGPSASLQALITARLDSLSPDERRLVSEASVLGPSFARSALTSADMSLEQLTATLESLQRKEIIVPEQGRYAAEQGRLRFVQETYRQIAYGMMTKRDRKARHIAAAEYLQSQAHNSGDDDLAAVIAQHLMDAADASSHDATDTTALNTRACDMLGRAAKRARSLGATVEALQLVLSAIERTKDARQLAGLHLSAAQDANDAARYPLALQHARIAMSEFDRFDEPVEAGMAAAQVGLAMGQDNDAEGALEILRPRLDALSAAPGSERALLQLTRAHTIVTVVHGSPSEALATAQLQELLAEESGEPQLMAEAQAALGVVLLFNGMPREGEALLRQAADIASDGGCFSQQAAALMNLGCVIMLRDPPGALPLLADSVAAARRSGVAMWVDWTRVDHALALWIVGRLDECSEVLGNLDADGSDHVARLMTLVLRGLVRAAGGQLVERPTFTPRESSAFEKVVSDALTILALHTEGDDAAAAALSRPALQRLVSWRGIDDDFHVFWTILVEAALHARDPDVALELLEPVASAPPAAVSPLLHAQYLRLRGAVGALRGDDDARVESDMRQALEALESLGMSLYAARARGELGAWLAQRGMAEGPTLIIQSREELAVITSAAGEQQADLHLA